MNNYNFTGRLGRDCETRRARSGAAICSFSVAVDYGYGDNKGTNWVRCSLFGKRAESSLPQYLTKGTMVAVSGELKISEYTAKDGVNRTSIDISVDKLDLIGGRSDVQGGDSMNLSRQVKSPASDDPFADSHDFGDIDDSIPF